MSKIIKIFDTTLREGLKTPGVNLNISEKVEIAKQLDLLQVDVMEAGFPIQSESEFESVKAVAGAVKNAVVCGFARSLTKDIDKCYEAIKEARRPRIHLLISTSEKNMELRRMNKQTVLKQTAEMVAYAKQYCEDVEFTAEDATRSGWEFLAGVYETAIAAGATVINVPDSSGYTTPDEYAGMIKFLQANVKNIAKAEISVHCHGDLGLATANAYQGILAGASQIHCTVNGLGERAGNTSLEEIVMLLTMKKNIHNFTVHTDIAKIHRSSALVSAITGIAIGQTKPVVGENAFIYEEDFSSDPLMAPQSIGLNISGYALSKSTSQDEFTEKVQALGYKASQKEIEKAYDKFKMLANKKKVVINEDIKAIVDSLTIKENENIPEFYQLEQYVINSGNTILSTASVKIIKEGEEVFTIAYGEGPIEAVFKAISEVVGIDFTLMDYGIRSVTEGQDAQGEVSVKIRKGGKIHKGKGLSTDIIEASIVAYINAINRMVYDIKRR